MESTRTLPMVGARDRATDESPARASRQAFYILQLAFTVAPIVAGLDKFFNVLVDWNQYLPGFVTRALGGNGHALNKHLLNSPIRVFTGLGLALALTIPAPAFAHGAHAKLEPAASLRQAMRGLWEDHVAWTRLVIVSIAADLPDREATTQRLLRNQQDIGDAVKPFYGDAAGERLTALLRAHIVGAAELLAAAKSGDAGKLETAKQAWYANADEVAGFLSAANPKGWPLTGMQSMMRTHLDLTLAEAVGHLQGRYAESVANYDKARAEILDMADMLTDGIVSQFPKRF